MLKMCQKIRSIQDNIICISFCCLPLPSGKSMPLFSFSQYTKTEKQCKKQTKMYNKSGTCFLNACHFNLTGRFQNWLLQLNLKIIWSLAQIKMAIVKKSYVCSKLASFVSRFHNLSRPFYFSIFSVFGITFGSSKLRRSPSK